VLEQQQQQVAAEAGLTEEEVQQMETHDAAMHLMRDEEFFDDWAMKHADELLAAMDALGADDVQHACMALPLTVCEWLSASAKCVVVHCLSA
jgi:hypothetical protein